MIMKYTSESNRFISLSFRITLVYHIISKYIFFLVHVNLLPRIYLHTMILSIV